MEKRKVIGSAVLLTKEFKKFREDEMKRCKNREPGWIGENWSDYFYHHQDLYKYATETYYSVRGGLVYEPHESYDQKIEKYQRYISENGLEWELLYEDEHIVVLQFADFAFGIPPYLAVTKRYENYDSLSIGQLRGLTGVAKENAIVPIQDLSMDALNNQMEAKKTAIDDAKKAIEDEEAKMKAEIEAAKREIEAMYAEKLEVIEAKKAELNEQVEKLNQQIFLLDTEIYGIRCFMGETVKFIHLRKGKGTVETEPVVLYQKLRYLDEEMGRLISLYDFGWSDVETFEEALKARDDLFELFAPGPKSISLVRLCRNKMVYDRQHASARIMEEYELLHAKRVAIMIRDGENLWMGWTEEERIYVKEDMFLQSKKEYRDVDEMPATAASSKEEIASRYFIFSILQGILRNGSLLKLPEEATIFRANPYVIFSAAEGWLEDNRFGSFSDIIARTNNQPLSKGDMILTTLRITRDDTKSGFFGGRSTVNDAYENDRGRGEKNRTHDVTIPNRAILPINCVDVTKVYRMHEKVYKCNVTKVIDAEETNGGNRYTRYHYDCERTDEFIKNSYDDFEIKNGFLKGINSPRFDARHVREDSLYGWYIDVCEKQWSHYSHNYTEDRNDDVHGYYKVPDRLEYLCTEYQYFVSGKKRFSENAFANMEIFNDEYLNLTYLNSVYVLYAIQNRKIGGWKSGSVYFDYASSIPYLNTALVFLREREKEEAAMLEKYMELYPDWQVDLSEWRMEHQYHRLTDKRAKKFATEKGLKK